MLRLLALLLALLPTLAHAQGVASPFWTGAQQPVMDCVFTSAGTYNTATNMLTVGPNCPGVHFNRASPKYDYGADGLLHTFATDVPAQPIFDPITGYALGLGIEGPSNFQNAWSNDLTNAGWTISPIGSVTAAFNQTGSQGIANSATLLTIVTPGGTICRNQGGSASQRVITAAILPVNVAGSIFMSPDGIVWTDVTNQMIAGKHRRLPVGGYFGQGPTAGVCFKGSHAGDQITVDEVNVEFDPKISNVPPTTPFLTTTAGASRAQDLPWIDLTKVPGFNPDSFTIVARGMIPTCCTVKHDGNTSSSRAWFSIDDGSATNGIYVENQQDPWADVNCGPGGLWPLNCNDSSLVPFLNGRTGGQTGKVRASFTSNSFVGLAPPGPRQFATVVMNYSAAGSALSVNTGGAPTTLFNGFYFPGGTTPAVTSPVSPLFAAGLLKRIVLGQAPNEATTIGGVGTTGQAIVMTGTWQDPPGTTNNATVTINVADGDSPATMAAATSAAITANALMAASGIFGTSDANGDVLPQHPPGLFVTWNTAVTGSGTHTETILQGGNASSGYMYFQQLTIYSPAIQSGNFQSVTPPTSPVTAKTCFFTMSDGSYFGLAGGGVLGCT